MSNTVKILLGVFGGLAVLALVVLLSVVGTYNGAITQERGIVNQYKENQNNMSQYTQKLLEVSQVPAMYSEDISKLFAKVVEGRKGSDTELFRSIKEANPTIDAGMYRQIQQVIEAGRNSFQAEQKTLLDKKRVYEVSLQSFPNNMILGSMGFPRIKMDDYDIVTDDRTDVAFKTKHQQVIKLRESEADKK